MSCRLESGNILSYASAEQFLLDLPAIASMQSILTALGDQTVAREPKAYTVVVAGTSHSLGVVAEAAVLENGIVSLGLLDADVYRLEALGERIRSEQTARLLTEPAAPARPPAPCAPSPTPSPAASTPSPTTSTPSISGMLPMPPMPELPTFSVEPAPLPLLVTDPQELEGQTGSVFVSVLTPLELPTLPKVQVAAPLNVPNAVAPTPAATASGQGEDRPTPPTPSATAVVQFEHRGTLATITRVEDLLESTTEPPLSKGPPLSVFRLVLAASRLGSAVTVSVGDWQIELNRSGHLLSLAAPGDEGVIQHMMRNRLLARSAGEAALETARHQGVPPEQLLLSRGQVTTATLAKGLQGFAVARSRDLVALADCPYVVTSGLRSKPQITTYSDRFLRELIKQSVRLLAPDALNAFFGERSSLALAIAGDAIQRIENLAQQPAEQRWIARQDGSLPLEEALHQCPVARPTALELVFALLAMGLAQLGPLSGADTGERTAEQTLRDWQKEVEGKTSFEALRLHWTAHASEIDDRMGQVRQQLAPDGALAKSSAEAAELAAALLQQAEAAYELLADPARRARARRQAAGASEVRNVRAIMETQISAALMRGDKRTASRMHDVLKELAT